MSVKNAVKSVGIQRGAFDELKNTDVVFCARFAVQ